jgi:putative transposase
VKGRKRHILTDYLGLLISVVVHSADIQDRDGAKILLEPLEFSRPGIEKIIGDGGYAGEALADWIYELRDDEHENQIELEIVKRSDLSQGFELLPHRWIVERTLSWLAKNRRLSKDYEIFTTTSEALIQLAMIKIMLKRLAT